MNDLQTQIKNYLEYCKCQKRLDEKTLKAYRIDLEQFRTKITAENIMEITSDMLEDFIAGLHQSYKPKTVKRKIASVKALFHYLEYKEIIDRNPFHKIHVKFREPAILPKTIPLLVAKVCRNICGVICNSMAAREVYLLIILRTDWSESILPDRFAKK